MKSAGDGDGSIVRQEEIAGGTEQTAMRPSHLHVRQAQRSNVGEDCAGDIPPSANAIHLPIKPFEILTLRLVGGGSHGNEGESHERTNVSQSGQAA